MPKKNNPGCACCGRIYVMCSVNAGSEVILCKCLSGGGSEIWDFRHTDGVCNTEDCMAVDADYVYLRVNDVSSSPFQHNLILKVKKADQTLDRVISCTDFERIHSIAVDPNGNIYTAGAKVVIEDGNKKLNYLAKFNASGVKLWLKQKVHGPYDSALCYAYGVDCDADGNTICACHSFWDESLYLIKHNTNGVEQWSKSEVGKRFYSALFDLDGNVYATQSIANQVLDRKIRKYDASGAEQGGNWPIDGYRYALGVDNAGAVYAVEESTYYMKKWSPAGVLQWTSSDFAATWYWKCIPDESRNVPYLTSGAYVVGKLCGSDGSGCWQKNIGGQVRGICPDPGGVAAFQTAG